MRGGSQCLVHKLGGPEQSWRAIPSHQLAAVRIAGHAAYLPPQAKLLGRNLTPAERGQAIIVLGISLPLAAVRGRATESRSGLEWLALERARSCQPAPLGSFGHNSTAEGLATGALNAFGLDTRSAPSSARSSSMIWCHGTSCSRLGCILRGVSLQHRRRLGGLRFAAII